MRLLSLVLLCVATTAHADDIVGKVVAHYTASSHWSGTFHQESVTHHPDVTQKTKGKVYFTSGGKLRIDAGPRTQIVDGSEFYFVDNKARAIIRRPIRDATLGAIALFAAADRLHDFTTKVTTATNAITVQLEPQKPTRGVVHVTWIVDPKDFHVREATVIDDGGNSERVIFDRLDDKAKVLDTLFTLDRKAKPLRTYSYDQLD
jgi:outer membrane lipoprotein-sorting protein